MNGHKKSLRPSFFLFLAYNIIYYHISIPVILSNVHTRTHAYAHIYTRMHTHTYRTAGNFRGRKLSRISRFSRHPRKFSPRNSGHATPIMRPVLTFRENFLREMLLSYQSAKVFSLENFPLYGTLDWFSTAPNLISKINFSYSIKSKDHCPP